MISNLGMVLRNILSKKSLVNYKVRGQQAVCDRACRHAPWPHVALRSCLLTPCPRARCCPRVPQHIDGINLFGLISIASLIYCIPAACVMEGSQWLPTWKASVAKLGKTALLQMLALSGVFYHLYNQVRGPWLGLDGGVC